MQWTVETLDIVDREIGALPPALQARLIRLMEAVESLGLEQIHEPHAKHIDGKLWELRVKSAEGIARGLYVTLSGRRIVICLCQENAEDAVQRLANCSSANETGNAMTKIAELKERLAQNPAFREEYRKADAEFSIIETLIHARREANLSQAELAEKLGTTQSAIARLEGGGVSPSLSTLRRYAEATGTRLEIALVAH